MEKTEPIRYAWVRDGLLVAGTIREYADMWEGDHYAGEDGLPTQLLTWDGVNRPGIHDVKITRGATSGEWVFYTITVPTTGETTHLKVSDSIV